MPSFAPGRAREQEGARARHGGKAHVLDGNRDAISDLA
jgi:hypothetical protein